VSAELWDFLFVNMVAKHWSQVISAEKKKSLVSTGTVFINCTQTDSAFQRVLIVVSYKYLHITLKSWQYSFFTCHWSINLAILLHMLVKCYWDLMWSF
jgi:hypothetical protein